MSSPPSRRFRIECCGILAFARCTRGVAQPKSEVMELIRSMALRPIDAGPIEVAGHLERMTVLLLSVNKANKVKDSGIQITGI